jgi:hypothetical protein
MLSRACERAHARLYQGSRILRQAPGQKLVGSGQKLGTSGQKCRSSKAEPYELPGSLRWSPHPRLADGQHIRAMKQQWGAQVAANPNAAQPLHKEARQRASLVAVRAALLADARGLTHPPTIAFFAHRRASPP